MHKDKEKMKILKQDEIVSDDYVNSNEFTHSGVKRLIPKDTKNSMIEKIAIVRGCRLATLRQLSGYPLHQFAIVVGLSPVTIKRLESGVTCLNDETANSITTQINSASSFIIVTSRWLMYGDQGGLTISKDKALSVSSLMKDLQDKHVDNEPSIQEASFIEGFLLFYQIEGIKLLNPDVIFCVVSDNKSELFQKGDHVAGKVVKTHEYRFLDKDVCIVKIKNKLCIRIVTYTNGAFVLSTSFNYLNSDVQILNKVPENGFARIWWTFKQLHPLCVKSSDVENDIVYNTAIENESNELVDFID